MKKKLITLALLGTLSACGGGGVNEQPTPESTKQTKRTEYLYYGYYGNNIESPLETVGHTNTALTASWGDDWYIMQEMLHNLKTFNHGIISLDTIVYEGLRPAQDIETKLRWVFSILVANNVLQKVVAIYPIDEPNLRAIKESDIIFVNDTIRRIASEYGLTSVKLAVIYAPNRGDDLPGLSNYDWVGIDDYDVGYSNLQWYNDIKPRLREDQRVILVPGGANPWKTPPQPFFDYAMANNFVAAIIPFIWLDDWDGNGTLGIRSNGMKQQYVQTGLDIALYNQGK